VKLGLLLPLFSGDPDRVRAAAVEAESLGFHGGFAFDHLFPPWADVSRPSLEVFTTLASVAAATSSLEIGTLVARVTIRPAGVLAKQACAIDQISGGRMILAVGTGDAGRDPEADTFGFGSPPAPRRRELLEETVGACRALFRGDRWPGGVQVPPLEGPLVPPPVRPGGPPIWIGGTGRAAIGLAARHADAWNGWGLDLGGFRERVDHLRAATEEVGREVPSTWAGLALVGRDEAELARLRAEREERGAPGAGVWHGTQEAFADHLRALRGSGAAWAIVMAAGPADRAAVIAGSARAAGLL
jgi:alkanesulfonate monooxygenase SsuD/methylene tetrahydromethanopterin reductase-like flavin-dependent oxidoreductase (luciferase family)